MYLGRETQAVFVRFMNIEASSIPNSVLAFCLLVHELSEWVHPEMFLEIAGHKCAWLIAYVETNQKQKCFQNIQKREWGKTLVAVRRNLCWDVEQRWLEKGGADRKGREVFLAGGWQKSKTRQWTFGIEWKSHPRNHSIGNQAVT